MSIKEENLKPYSVPTYLKQFQNCKIFKNKMKKPQIYMGKYKHFVAFYVQRGVWLWFVISFLGIHVDLGLGLKISFLKDF